MRKLNFMEGGRAATAQMDTRFSCAYGKLS